MPNYIPGSGSITARLMVVGEAPGKNEDEQGLPFVGPTGEMLWEWLALAGVKRSEVWVTNVVKYRPPLNDLKKLHLIGVDINEQIEDLWKNEIRVIRPNCILAVGDLALQATTGYSGILNYRGSILRGRDGDFKVVATIHPAALFNRSGSNSGGLEYTYAKLIKHDIRRAVEESLSPSYEIPDRILSVAHNSLDVHRYFDSYKHLDKAAMDIESINCVPVCVGFAFSRHHALSIPLLQKIGNINLTDMGGYELNECWKEIDRQLRRLKLIGHNLKYDEYKLSLIGFKCPNVYSDTLIKTRVIFPELPEKNLGVVSSLWTREPYYKSEGKEFKLGKDKIDKLFLYNAKDCAVEFEVDEEQEIDLLSLQEQFGIPLVDYYYNYQMRKHKFYLKMENNGFRVDFARQKELRKLYTQLQKDVHEKLIERIGHDVNVKSYPQVYDLLYKEMKFRVMKRDPTSEDTIISLLGNHAKTDEKKAILVDLLEERRIRDQKSRYINFYPDYDGTCKTSYNIIATETCRSSTSILKKPIRPKKIGLAFHTVSKHGRLAKDIRSMLIARPGYVLIQVDGSQAEARVVAVLSEDWELLQAFDTVDIHRRTAGMLFGYVNKLILSLEKVDLVDQLPKDGPERFTGKICRHAGNYNMQKRRLMTEFNTLSQKFDIPMSISEWKAGKLLELFHEASPKIRKIFHKDIEDCINNTRTIIDPMGGIRIFCGRLDDELYKEAYANIPQRTVAHLVQKAALDSDDEFDHQIRFISENHDSLLIEAPEDDWQRYALVLKKNMEREIDFSLYCSLKRKYKLRVPCDVEISNTHYGAMEKAKI